MTSLWDAFVAVVDENPSDPALIFPDREIPFAAMKDYAERCATFLAERQVRKGMVVALQLPKRVETYALFLACLRLGAPYVFIDPKNPPERSARIIERVRPALLFTTGQIDNGGREVIRLPSAEGGFSWLDELRSAVEIPPPSRLSGADAAYIMFTSGSTGEPKGAVIPHEGVLTLMAWGRAKVGPPRGQRFTNINPLHFDNSVFDLYCGLLNGAALIPIETGDVTNPAAWTKAMRQGNATVVFAVPTLFLFLDRLGLLTPSTLPSVTTFIFGGEGFPIGTLRDFFLRFRNRARLINVYGPTETSCICTSLILDEQALEAPDTSFPPLGTMHDNFSYAILDDQGRPAGPAGIGELWIGGPCVGLGYYGNAQETAARFVQDPRHDRYRSIFYRSGDLVREDQKGNLWFHGRVDNQVKIRGHRIELEELDLAVQSVPGVRRALSVVLGGPDGDELAVAMMADRKIASEEILAVCKQRLPAYMRPSLVLQFDDLPRNANGKVDRLAVKAYFQERRHPIENENGLAVGRPSDTRRA